MMFTPWDHQFCLACDKQVNVDGAAYCSEACRLADFEKTSSPTISQASSPGFAPSSYTYKSAATAPSTTSARPKFYLSPAYDFSNATPYNSAPPRKSYFEDYSVSHETPAPNARNLSPSSSHSSLCSIQTTTSAEDASRLSDTAKQELRAYAISFEQVRMQRRRSH